MRKRPVVHDYGGNNRRAPAVALVTNALSFRCAACTTVRYVTRIELGRAAKPRCLKCGGPLVETAATETKLLGPKRERKARARAARRAAVTARAAPAKCWTCGAVFGDVPGLAVHVAGDAFCRSGYVRDNKIIGGACAGTAHRDRQTVLVASPYRAGLVPFRCHNSLAAADAAVELINTRAHDRP